MANRDNRVRKNPVDMAVAMSTSACDTLVEQASRFGVVPERAWSEADVSADVDNPWDAFVMSTFEPGPRPHHRH